MGKSTELEPLKELDFSIPLVLDSTKIVSYRHCPYKFFLSQMNHIRASEETPIALHFGGVVATGLEFFRRHAYTHHHLHEPALAYAIQAMALKWGDYTPLYGDYRTWERAVLAVHKYFQKWPTYSDEIIPMLHGPNNDPSFEFSFAVELPESEGFPLHPTGSPFILAGREDLMGYMRKEDNSKGLPVIEDDKTSKVLGQTWPDQWPMRHQFMLYVWALRRLKYPHRHVIVRGICPRANDIDLVQTLPLRFPDHLLDKFEFELKRTLFELVRAHELSFKWGSAGFERRFGDACMSYFRPCQFTHICNATPENELGFLKTMPREEWDPLGEEEVLLQLPKQAAEVLSSIPSTNERRAVALEQL